MSVRPRAAREPEAVLDSAGYPQVQSPAGDKRMVWGHPAENSSAGAGFSKVDFHRSRRLSVMLVPNGRGSFGQQLAEVLEAQTRVLGAERTAMTVTSQTVFLSNAVDLAECQQTLRGHYGAKFPATNFVLQPPCCGAALALEAWAIGGQDVVVKFSGPHTVRIEHEDACWTYCSGVRSDLSEGGAYQQTLQVLHKIQAELKEAGSGFEQVVRTWLYLGAITEPDAGSQRYKELNRARAEFYGGIKFHCSPSQPNIPQGIYPASTGIGMKGTGLVAGCLALETKRADAFLLALENPQQTPAYAYHPRYSPQSPKFSRAVALVLGDYVTTWLSGTASVVHSLSRHPGDIRKQTEQTIENIERLISAENFGFHGVKRAGAHLTDLAKIRVYLKRPEDFGQCKAICEKRFGSVPAIYAVADVCRPELLVEIEGVAFSKLG